MSESAKKTNTAIVVLRYIGLVLLTLVFAIAGPLLLIAQRTYDGLTTEATYSAILDDLGLGANVLDLVSLEDIAPEMLVDMVKAIKPEGTSPLDELTGELKKAAEKTRANVVSQIPVFVKGEQEKLKASVDLTDFRKRALEMATKYTPGGAFGAAIVRQGIEGAVPKSYELDDMLGPLETILIPIRKTVAAIKERITHLRIVAITAFALIGLVAFQIKRAFIWLGIAACSAGVVGFIVGSLASGLVDMMLPELIGASFWKALISNSVTGYQQISLISVGVGLGVISLGLFVCYLVDRLGRDPGR